MNRLIAAATLCAGALFLQGCGAGNVAAPASKSDDHPQLVELFSWWTAPGEAEALQALVDSHKLVEPNARIFNAAAASGTRAQQILDERLAKNDPPDLFQENAHDVRAFLKQNPGKLQALDGLFDSLGLRQKVLPEVINDVSIDGHIYSLPLNIHRENALFYNKALFAQHGISPPNTLHELLRACETLKAAGVTPIATSHQGWILRIMFNSIALGKMGSELYYQYFKGMRAPEEPALREAINTFGDVLEKYTNADAGEDGFGWTNAAQAVYNGDAAMFMHGDWTTGHLTQLGWKPDVDFGVIGSPGASDMFLYGIDVFALPAGAKSDEAARDFLSTFASTSGQVSFNRLKGSSPIRFDVPRERMTGVGRATLADLEHARFRMLVRSLQVWDDAFNAFAKKRDRDALYQVFVSNPPSH